MEVRHLKRLWSRVRKQRETGLPAEEGSPDWCPDNTLLCGLGLSLHETLRYLYSESPSFATFEQWVLEINGGAIDAGRIERLNAALAGTLPEHGEPVEPVLTAEDLAFFDEHGYVILHDAVPTEVRAEAERAVWEWVGGDPEHPETWYGGPHGHSIWVPLLHHPAQRAVRESRRIFAAFAQLWGRTDLWATTDQAGFNPPERADWPFPGPRLHWDMSLELPVCFGLQGILYLSDTGANQGAFTCVPGFHRQIEDWLRQLPPGTDPRQQDLAALGAIPVAGRAGDLVIWHQALPHGSSPNHSLRPRIVQYVTLRPTRWERTVKWK